MASEPSRQEAVPSAEFFRQFPSTRCLHLSQRRIEELDVLLQYFPVIARLVELGFQLMQAKANIDELAAKGVQAVFIGVHAGKRIVIVVNLERIGERRSQSGTPGQEIL